MRWALALALPLWAACAFGSPLVDDQDDKLDGDGLMCNIPPPCKPRQWHEPTLPPQSALDLTRCDGHALCSPPRASSDAPAPAGAPTSCASESVDALPLTADCLQQKLHAPEGVSELSYKDAHWSNFDLSIETSAPLRIALNAPQLHAVAIHLKGPVELHIADAKPMDVRFYGEASAAGEPRLSLLNVEAEQMRVGERDHAFAGALIVRATEIKVLELYANELDLESSHFEQGRVYVAGSSVADASWTAVDLHTQHAIFSAFEASDCRMQLCMYASLLDSKLHTTIVDVCPDTRVRLYGSIVTSSALDGAFEADDTDFENDLLGAAHATQLISWQSRVSSTALCGELDLFALDCTSLVKCNECAPSFEKDTETCEFAPPPDAASPIQSNFCPALKRGSLPPLCSSDLPTRTRMR